MQVMYIAAFLTDRVVIETFVAGFSLLTLVPYWANKLLRKCETGERLIAESDLL